MCTVTCTDVTFIHVYCLSQDAWARQMERQEKFHAAARSADEEAKRLAQHGVSRPGAAAAANKSYLLGLRASFHKKE